MLAPLRGRCAAWVTTVAEFCSLCRYPLHPCGCVRWLLISAASSAAFLARAAVRLDAGPVPSPLSFCSAPQLFLCGGLNSEDSGVVDFCSFPLSSPPLPSFTPLFGLHSVAFKVARRATPWQVGSHGAPCLPRRRGWGLAY